MHHVDPFEVDESFADLQAEQHQGYICQLVLVLSQVVPQLQECQHVRQAGISLTESHFLSRGEAHEFSCNVAKHDSGQNYARFQWAVVFCVNPLKLTTIININTE